MTPPPYDSAHYALAYIRAVQQLIDATINIIGLTPRMPSIPSASAGNSPMSIEPSWENTAPGISLLPTIPLGHFFADISAFHRNLEQTANATTMRLQSRPPIHAAPAEHHAVQKTDTFDTLRDRTQASPVTDYMQHGIDVSLLPSPDVATRERDEVSPTMVGLDGKTLDPAAPRSLFKRTAAPDAEAADAKSSIVNKRWTSSDRPPEEYIEPFHWGSQ